eukprot:3359408-Rhodomonas_salina.1
MPAVTLHVPPPMLKQTSICANPKAQSRFDETAGAQRVVLAGDPADGRSAWRVGARARQERAHGVSQLPNVQHARRARVQHERLGRSCCQQ